MLESCGKRRDKAGFTGIRGIWKMLEMQLGSVLVRRAISLFSFENCISSIEISADAF